MLAMLAVKKNVLSAVLKLSKDGEMRTEHGRLFHAAGPATTNARPPNFHSSFVSHASRSLLSNPLNPPFVQFYLKIQPVKWCSTKLPDEDAF